jgi:hypothetical protein
VLAYERKFISKNGGGVKADHSMVTVPPPFRQNYRANAVAPKRSGFYDFADILPQNFCLERRPPMKRIICILTLILVAAAAGFADIPRLRKSPEGIKSLSKTNMIIRL